MKTLLLIYLLCNGQPNYTAIVKAQAEEMESVAPKLQL